jgi:hypothetical protein
VFACIHGKPDLSLPLLKGEVRWGRFSARCNGTPANNLKMAKIIDRPGLCGMVRAAGKVPSARRLFCRRSAWVAGGHAAGYGAPALSEPRVLRNSLIGWHPNRHGPKGNRAC